MEIYDKIEENIEEAQVSNHGGTILTKDLIKKLGFEYHVSLITRYSYVDENEDFELFLDPKDFNNVTIMMDNIIDWGETNHTLEGLNKFLEDFGVNKRFEIEL